MIHEWECYADDNQIASCEQCGEPIIVDDLAGIIYAEDGAGDVVACYVCEDCAARYWEEAGILVGLEQV